MRVGKTLTVAAGLVLLGGCGDHGPAARTSSGITGLVHLVPPCAVETVEDPCADHPAAGVTVTVSEQIPGDASSAAGKPVAQVTTDTRGGFRIVVEPGDYIVTAEAGMSCELMDAGVTEGSYLKVDIRCDSGIR